jgi:hypothetical protein
MDNAPDLMDDTFLLAGRAAAYAPRMLLHEMLLPLLLDTAMVSLIAQSHADLQHPYVMVAGWVFFWGGIVTRRHVRSQQEWHCLPR